MTMPKKVKCPACGFEFSRPSTQKQVAANRKNAKKGGWPKGRKRK